MADLKITGIDELNAAFNRIANIPENKTKEALKAMAEVAKKKIKSTGEAMGVRDPESDVHILDKLSVRKPVTTPSGGYADVVFSGTRPNGKGRRIPNAEIAFYNEVGTDKIDARPFVGTAMSQNEAEITAPGAEIIGNWIENEYQK